MTEQGCAWVPEALRRMDAIHDQMANGRIGELVVHADAVLARRPSEYFATNCYVGASFPTPSDAALFRSIGLDRIMWGSDYPHHESTYPFTRESLRLSFHDFTPAELQAILGHTAAEVYGFDMRALALLAAEHGPTRDELAVPLDVIPSAATSPAFASSELEHD